MKSILDKIKGLFGKKSHFEDTAVSENSTLAESSSNADGIAPVKQASVTRPPLEGLYPYILCVLIGYFAADLGILAYRDLMLPTSAPAVKPQKRKIQKTKLKSDYNIIAERNIFNSDGLIPPPLGPGGKEGEAVDDLPMADGPAVPTELPIKLLGTIVHVNPAKSVATLEVKQGGDKVLPYIPNDDIEGIATMVRVERKRAIFRNEKNGRLEYAEIKDDTMISFAPKTPKKSAGKNNIQRDGNRFTLNRNDVDKHMKNLPQLLQQARAVPNIVPGSGGQIEGFRLLDIQPGSIYESLGLKVGDVLKGVNGESLTSPAQAIEMYQALKSEDRISLEIERNGRSETMNYSIE